MIISEERVQRFLAVIDGVRGPGVLVLLLLASPACAAGGTSALDVRELPFSERHEGCVPLFTAEGTGADQAEARANVLETVAEGGGNAVVFVGARITRDPATGRVGAHTERGLAYDCTAGEMGLREAALRTLIARYDALEEQFDDPVGRRYCLAFDETVEAEGRRVDPDFLERFTDHGNVHPRGWCRRHAGRVLSVGPIEWIGPGEARVWSFSWVESRPGGADCLLRMTKEEGGWRAGEGCEGGLIYD